MGTGPTFGWLLAAGILVLPGLATGSAGAESPPLDRYGDPLPASAVMRLGTVRFRHGADVYALAYSPDGKRLASASADGTVRLWEADTGKEARRLAEHHRAVFCLAFSSDGKTLASGGDGGSLSLWDTGSGKERQLQGHDGMVMGLGFTPDGQGLIGGGERKVIHLWSVKTGEILRRFEMTEERVSHVVLSPNGKLLGAAGERQPLLVWDLATGKEVRRFDPNVAGISCLAFSPDSNTLAFCCRKNHLNDSSELNLVNVGDGKPVCRVSDDSIYNRLAFSPDGRLLAAAGEYPFLEVIEGSSGKRLARFACGIEARAVAFSPDSKVLACGGWDGRIRLWDVADGAERFADLPTVRGPAQFAADGRTLFLRSARTKIDVWSTTSWKRRQRFEWPSPMPTGPSKDPPLAISADGLFAATGGQDGKVSLWERATGARQAAFDAHRHDISGLRFVGRDRLLSWGEDVTMRLATLPAGKELWRIPMHQPTSTCVSPDGRLIAAGVGRNYVGVWDMTSGKQIYRFKAPHYLEGLTFSPDSNLLAGAGLGGVIHLWRTDTGREVEQLRAKGTPWITALAFSPDGRTLAAASGEMGPGLRHLPGGSIWVKPPPKYLPGIETWEIASGKIRHCFQGHQNRIDGLAFSPDGSLLVSTSEDTTALAWDVTGRRLHPVKGGLLNRDQLDALWADLASPDAARAWAAIRALTDRPEQAVSWLAKRVEPVSPPDPQQLARWIADLDADEFATRQKASRALESLGPVSEPALRKVLAGAPSLEAQRRINQVLIRFERLTLPADQLRFERVLEALERMGTTEARQVVTRLAAGAPGARLTRGAKTVLARQGRQADRGR